MNFLPDLAPQFLLPWWGWALSLLAVAIIGTSKAGLKGTASFIVTIMALLYGGKASTGIIVPMLIVGDIAAVIYYHKHAQWSILRKLIPAMFVGIAIGAWVGNQMSEVVFTRTMAVVIIFSVISMIWMDRDQRTMPRKTWIAASMGILAGISTMIGNLAGAFANLYFLAIRLPKNELIGTAAWLFLMTNCFKIPFHYFYWKTITPDTLALNIRLLPALVVGFFLGVKLVHLIKEKQYRYLILVMTSIGAIVILFK